MNATRPIADAIAALEEAFPPALQEKWDNSGLQTGNPHDALTGILLAVDVTEATVDEAVSLGCNLIVSHHPLIFGGVRRLTGADATQRILIKAIRHGIAVYSAHTNADRARAATSSLMADCLGLADRTVLVPAAGSLVKIVTYVPAAHADAVRRAMFDAGAGCIGNYDCCSSNAPVTGTFRAGKGTHPFVGEPGRLHSEAEVRIETIAPEHCRRAVTAALCAAHPYEEPAFDIFPLLNDWGGCGYGVVGRLPEPMPKERFLAAVKERFGCGALRFSDADTPIVSRVAMCSGSGSEFIGRAMAAGAQAYVTADVKYHSYFEAEDRMMIVDVGHYESEQFSKILFRQALIKKMPTFAPCLSTVNSNPIKYY